MPVSRQYDHCELGCLFCVHEAAVEQTIKLPLIWDVTVVTETASQQPVNSFYYDMYGGAHIMKHKKNRRMSVFLCDGILRTTYILKAL